VSKRLLKMIKLKNSVDNFKVLKVNRSNSIENDDLIVAEEPLQIKLQFFQDNEWIEKSLTITMRTPGNDFELTLGFLHNESIINSAKDILQIKYCETVKP